MISSWINRPIHFASGHFRGQTIRTELEEIQKADLGRKYARVDRRPLDPPPVVRLRLYEVFNFGTDTQYEKEISDYSDTQTLGLLCYVDLFPVPMQSLISTQTAASSYEPCHLPRMSGRDLPEPSSRSLFHHSYPRHDTSQHPHTPAMPNQTTPQDEHVPPDSDVLTHFNDQPITEDMKRTSALSGATFVQSAVIDHQGRKTLVFAFADLAVKIEGQFFLRYRCFDIFSRVSEHDDLPIQSECYGGAFKIYSTKEFPGLQASTELTKQLARWGMRLNTRETERKRKRKSPAASASASASASTSMKGKERDADSDSGYE
ncbi:velvet factor-domain-containing protein [Scleroderma citrinum]